MPPACARSGRCVWPWTSTAGCRAAGSRRAMAPDGGRTLDRATARSTRTAPRASPASADTRSPPVPGARTGAGTARRGAARGARRRGSRTARRARRRSAPPSIAARRPSASAFAASGLNRSSSGRLDDEERRPCARTCARSQVGGSTSPPSRSRRNCCHEINEQIAQQPAARRRPRRPRLRRRART